MLLTLRFPAFLRSFFLFSICLPTLSHASGSPEELARILANIALQAQVSAQPAPRPQLQARSLSASGPITASPPQSASTSRASAQIPAQAVYGQPVPGSPLRTAPIAIPLAPPVVHLGVFLQNALIDQHLYPSGPIILPFPQTADWRHPLRDAALFLTDQILRLPAQPSLARAVSVEPATTPDGRLLIETSLFQGMAVLLTRDGHIHALIRFEDHGVFLRLPVALVTLNETDSFVREIQNLLIACTPIIVARTTDRLRTLINFFSVELMQPIAASLPTETSPLLRLTDNRDQHEFLTILLLRLGNAVRQRDMMALGHLLQLISSVYDFIEYASAEYIFQLTGERRHPS